jgi:type VI secretion system secreted protein VgrG
VGIARNINGAMIPTYGLPAKKTMMTIKTQTYPGGGGFNELRLDDVAGAMRFDMKAERDMLGVVRRNRTETIGANEDHKVDASMTHSVERDQTRTVSGNEDTTVDGSVQLSVTGNREMSVKGSEKVKVESAQNVLVDGDDTEEIGGDLTTDSGDGGSIIRTTEAHLKRTIKGSFTAKAKGAIEHQAGKEHKETVEGAKVTTVSDGGILQTCSGMMTVDVTGSLYRTAKEDMSVSAKESFINLSASAALQSADKIDIRGEVIEIEAKSRVTLSAAGLLIEMTPAGMKMTGNVRMETDNVIRYSGNPENLTK